MPYAQTKEVKIYYKIQGSGPAIVLISGLGYDQWMWHQMIPGLAENFQVIVFDNRGMGKTDIPAGPYNASMLAADTIALMDVLGIQSATVMGHSMGGFIAQAMALEYPQRIDKLILSATNFGGPRHVPITPEAMSVLTDMQSDPIVRLRKGILISCADGFQEAQPVFIEHWVQYRLAHPISPEGYQAQLAIGMGLLSAEAAFDGKLEKISAPTLILFGEHDKVVPPENARLFQEQIPNSRVQILKNAGHFFPFEIPAQAVEAITAFIQGS